jgi:hypothetical protein
MSWEAGFMILKIKSQWTSDSLTIGERRNSPCLLYQMKALQVRRR